MRQVEAEWQQDAACKGEWFTKFYPPLAGESRQERARREESAKQVCRHCPVAGSCLDHALRHDERYGIWGGLTDGERRQLRRTA